VAETEYQFGRFHYVEIADFTDEQMRGYARKWFAGSRLKRDRFLEDFAREEQWGLRELGRTPLLLSMLCLAFDETESFPQRRVDAYQAAMDALLKRWDEKRGIERDGIYRWLSPDHRLQMLTHIAAKTFPERKVLFGQEELVNQLVAYLRRLLPASAREKEIDGEAELRAIKDQHLIFVERAQRVHSFSHLTFQEYLTARYIVDYAARVTKRHATRAARRRAARATRRLRHNGHGTSEPAGAGWLKSLFDQYLTDDRWREVFLLTASMLDDADLFFEQFARALERMAREEDLTADLVSWADEQAKRSGSKGTEPPGMRSRCMCYALALARALARDRNLARDRALARDLARDLDRDLERTRKLALSLDLDRDRARELALELDRAHARALDRQLERARARDVELDRALARSRSLARDLDLDIEYAFVRDLEREGSFARARARDFARELDRARARALALDLDFERALARDLDRERALARDLDRASALERARALALDRARTLDFGLDFDFERARELALDLDLAKAHSLTKYLAACRLFVGCLEAANVSDRVGLRDRLLRVPMDRQRASSEGEQAASRVQHTLPVTK
jgi:hypothetical protein